MFNDHFCAESGHKSTDLLHTWRPLIKAIVAPKVDRNFAERVLWVFHSISSVTRCGFALYESRKLCRNRHFCDGFWGLYTETRLGGGETEIRILGTPLAPKLLKFSKLFRRS